MADLTFEQAAEAVVVVDENQNKLVINPDGSTNIVVSDATKVAYSAGIRGLVPAAAATDVLVIQGSATKAVKIRRIRISGTQTGNGVTPIVLIKRSTADSGGTSTTLTNVPHDSSDPAGTAAIKAYTANPTLGTAVGSILQEQISFNNGLASGLEDKIDYEFGIFTKAIILRNANESLVVNFNGASVTSGSINFTVDWTEE